MPSTSARLRPVIVALATAATAVLSLTGATAPATTSTAAAARSASTGPVYSGKGWTANTKAGIYSLPPGPFTIVFANATARSKLTKYLTGPASQLTSVTGVRFTVSTTIDTTPLGTCPAKGRIIAEYKYRPLGTRGTSNTRVCSNTYDGSVWGARIQMDSEYWQPGWFGSTTAVDEIWRRNMVTHEVGHAAGLGHPNRDLDRDGKVEAYECDKNTSGWLPVVCSPNGGVRTAQYAGGFTALEVPGLRQMARNYYLR